MDTIPYPPGLQTPAPSARVNLSTTGALAGILGSPTSRRFSNDAQLAAYVGVASLEASSAGAVRHRLSREGNRELNAIVTGSPSHKHCGHLKPGRTYGGA